MPIDYSDASGAYGMPPDRTIRGVVRSPAQEPIPGIKVSVKDLPSYNDSTDSKGNFYVFHVPRQESYELEFEDVDGDDNGGSFTTLTKKISYAQTNDSLVIKLELKE
jgi:putative lipoprotein (rSAM/lipoprotein system)